LAKKNIAVLIDWYLPGNKAGGPVRSVFSLLNLVKDEYNFHVITKDHDLGSALPYQNIRSDQWSTYDGVPVYYFSETGFNSAKLLEVINSVHPDIVYLNSFWSYDFSILPLRLKKAGKISAEVILAPRGMLGMGALSIKPLKKKLFLSLLKVVDLHSKVTFHATTTDEEKEIRRVFKNAKVRIASNVNSTKIRTDRAIGKKKWELRLFFLSRISRVKNLHYALEILRDLGTDGNIVYDIYGSMEDKLYWKECESIISSLPSNIKVNYRGDLSFEKVQNTIEAYHFLFLPTLNENFGHSIYESLVSACPVIISDTTPWNGINEAGCGFAIPLKEKEGFEKAIREALAMDEAAYSSVWKNCVKFMSANAGKDTEKKAYLELFK
jgi:glycosyltransferase involved in cell wall biosynthesis